MKIAAALMSLAFAVTPVFAADAPKTEKPKKAPSAAQQAQRNKMKECNVQAAGKKGDERKAFMKQCLSSGHAAATPGMSACESQAAEKKLAGAAKTSFVKKCQADGTAAK